MKIKHLSKKAQAFFKAGQFNPSDDLDKARNKYGESLFTYTISFNTMVKQMTEEKTPNKSLLKTLATMDSLEVFKELIQDKVNVNQRDDQKPIQFTPLTYALLKKELEMIDLLLGQNTIDANATATKGKDDPMTPLNLAAIHKTLPVVNKLMELKADINALSTGGETALFGAAHAGDYDIVKVLVEKKADVNVCNKAGASALTLSMKHHKKIAKLLVENKATFSSLVLNPEKRQFEVQTNPPLPLSLLSVFSSDPEKMAGSLQRKLTLELCIAASENEVDRIKELVMMKADINANHIQNNKACTALHFACIHGRFEAAKLLIELGADKFAKSQSGKTPLEFLKGDQEKFSSMFDKTQKLEEKEDTSSAVLMLNNS